MDELPELSPVPAAKLRSMIDDGIPALDVRPPEEFAAGHVPGSINIGLSGQFASWAGSLLGLKSRPVLIADSQPRIDEARMRLARVGIEELSGYLDGGLSGWKQAGLPLEQLPQMTVQDLNQRRRGPGLQVLDVRRAGEWEAGHITEAQLWPLDRFKEALPQMDKSAPVAVHCKSGYRSTIACSLLMRAGNRNVTNVVGGFDAWQNAQLPVAKDETIAV